MRYYYNPLKGAIKANSQCTAAMTKEIKDSVILAGKVLRRAYLGWSSNTAAFKRWFGDGNAHDNENVKLRYSYAMKFLQNKSGGNFNILCCRA